MKTAKTSVKVMRSRFVASCAALLVLGTLSFAGAAQARDDVLFSVGLGVPAVGVSNAYPVYTQPVYSQPVYPQPVYVQPQPVYVQPRPVYVQPAPIYAQPAQVYYQNAPVYYGRPHHHHGHRGGGYYVQTPRPGYGPGYYGQRYAPVYYQR